MNTKQCPGVMHVTFSDSCSRKSPAEAQYLQVFISYSTFHWSDPDRASHQRDCVALVCVCVCVCMCVCVCVRVCVCMIVATCCKIF